VRVLLIPHDLDTPWEESHLRTVAARDGVLYCGWYDTDGQAQVYRVEHHGEGHPLTATPLEHRVIHSPTGFAWGYGGSGPADLAYNLLRDYVAYRLAPSQSPRQRAELADHVASELHQAVKSALVAAFPERWLLPGRALHEGLRAMLARASRSEWWLTPIGREALELVVGEKEGGPRKAATR